MFTCPIGQSSWQVCLSKLMFHLSLAIGQSLMTSPDLNTSCLFTLLPVSLGSFTLFKFYRSGRH